MFKLKFSQSVPYPDGIERTTECDKFFEEKDVLNRCLAVWDGCSGPNGGYYHYFVTPVQELANKLAQRYTGEFKWNDFCMINSHDGYFIKEYKYDSNGYLQAV